ncbi:MAG: bacteriohopanetetrol glucosamine biosynthesis glycosyltransferase HpnI [Chloroflexi bacterium]|nr:bacteriohopanetetrol glucosamine biosynthesis glycosyltransferase HpnI [Chloroflexota bacterium]
MLAKLILLMVVLSWLYWAIACLATRSQLTQKPVFTLFTPPVSILKPLRGTDFELLENLRSFCRQDYPEFEIVFGVADPTDPALEAVEQARQEFPHLSLRVIVGSDIGANPKASLLHHISYAANHDVLVISDSDMRVGPDYLKHIVAPLADKQVGLVTCPYIGLKPLTLTARLEALYIGVHFIPSAIVARRCLGMPFAMGSTVAMRRDDLFRLGGFAALADYLADDYEIGARTAALGLQVHLSDYVVPSVLGTTTFRQQWEREVRWARCSKASRPLGYLGYLLTFSTPLATLLAIGGDGNTWPLLWPLVISLLVRWFVGWLVTGYEGQPSLRRWLVLLPLRDMLTALVWCAGAVGSHVSWRGRKYRVHRDGRMEFVRLTDSAAAHKEAL